MSESAEGQPESTWDLEPVLAFLSARTEADAETAWVDALPRLSETFDPSFWGVGYDINTYEGPRTYANLYAAEAPPDFRRWLAEQGITEGNYGDHIGPIQFVSVQMHLLSLMPHGRANTGWRVRLLGYPALGLIVLGLGSHYQGTPAQNRLGLASRLIRQRALEVVPEPLREKLAQWPSATAQDWDERGLFAEFSFPPTQVGTIDISSYDDGRGARLKMVRNTTVKKDLSTFFAIRGMPAGEFATTGGERLRDLRDIAFALGRPEDS